MMEGERKKTQARGNRSYLIHGLHPLEVVGKLASWEEKVATTLEHLANLVL